MMTQFFSRRAGRCIGLCAIVLSSWSAAAQGRVWYVDDTAYGTNNGINWYNAFGNLQSAIDAANDGDEIRVAQGTYIPTKRQQPDDPRSARFELRKSLTLIGGYAGIGASDPDARDPYTWRTTLSGDRNGDDGPNFSNMGDNCYQVIVSKPYGITDLHVEGFLITGAYSEYGRGIYGGGFYAQTCNLRLKDCIFLNNKAYQGGGLYFDGNRLYSEFLQAIIINCSFLGNQVVDSIGGSGVLQYDGEMTLVNCIFSGNQNQGDLAGIGAFLIDGGSNTTYSNVINCTFSNNKAIAYGAAIGQVTEATVKVHNCIFHKNNSQWIEGGLGEVWFFHDNYEFTHNCIRDWTEPGAEGIIDADPLFVDADGFDNIPGTLDDDLRLRQESPCIDAGSAAVLPADAFDLDDDGDTDEPLPLDLIGHNRNQGATVDLGACEGAGQHPILYTDHAEVPEGTSMIVGVRLALPPAEPITLQAVRHAGDPDLGAHEYMTFTFDATNYAIPQPIVLYANEDDDFLNGTAVFEISGAGRWSTRLEATELDNEPAPRVLHVDADRGPGGDGSSWETAYADLQDTLAAAAQAPAVEEIWVAAGTYRPDQGTGDRDASFYLQNGLALYGGFAGNETQRNQRDPRHNETILSGDLLGNDQEVESLHHLMDHPSRSENTYTVVISKYVDDTTILDGFTISGGQSNWDFRIEPYNVYHNSGGGLLNHNAHPVIRNCRFINHFAHYGAALYSEEGGGMTLHNCYFSNNYAEGEGGAINLNTGGHFVTNCIIFNNWSDYYGAGISCNRANLTLTNCSIVANSAGNCAGGISYFSGHDDPTIHMEMNNCIMWGNTDNCSTISNRQVYLVGSVSKAEINHCCIQDWDGSLGGVGNFSAEPMFVSTDLIHPDLHLKNESSCKNAGNNAALPIDWYDLDEDGDDAEPLPMDIAGTPRVLEKVVDLGAYEEPALYFVIDQQELSIPEGTSSTVRLRLSRAPEQPLTASITYAYGDLDILLDNGTEFAFDANNYAQGVDISFFAFEEADWRNDFTVFELTAPGITTLNLVLHEQDNDPVPPIVHVKAEADGANNGGSWQDAFVELRDALEAAKTRSEVQDIWVAQGTYKPAPANGDRNAYFRLLSGVRLLGGFAGDEDQASQRDPENHPTILSGDLNGNDGFGETITGQEENSYHVVYGENLDDNTVLDGFIIRSGNADMPWEDFEKDRWGGGGAYFNDSDLTLQNCTIEYSQAESGAGIIFLGQSGPTMNDCIIRNNRSYYFAGGVSFQNTETTTVKRCKVLNNYAERTGGIHCSCPDALFVDCVIDNNTSWNYAGGIECGSNGSQIYRNCIISNNKAISNGGGLKHYNWHNSYILLYNCRFENNSSHLQGGGIDTSYGSITDIIDCHFTNNISRGGGAISIWKSDTCINKSVFMNNHAKSGGAISFGNSNPQISNCLFTINTAESQGGALLYNDTQPILNNCTFNNNSAEEGGAISQGSNTFAQIRNCILSNNTAQTGSNIFLSDYYNENMAIDIDHCNLQGGPSSIFLAEDAVLEYGAGNIDVDPLFIDGGYRLRADSPCVDAGDNGYVPTGRPTDLMGCPRIGNGMVDMGAYEYWPFGLTAAVSRRTHASAGAFDVDFLAGQTEPRDGGPRELIFTFSDSMTAADGLLDDEVSLSCGRIDAVDLMDNQLTVRCSEVPDDICVQIGINGLHAPERSQDWSGQLDLEVVCGDVADGGGVNVLDVISTKLRSGQMTDDDNFRADVLCQGYINVAAIIKVKQQTGGATLCPE